MSHKFLQNLIGALVRIGVGLLVIPFYIKEIGTERFGILSLVWVMLGYLGVLDLGMSRSSTNALAGVDHGDTAHVARIFTTALVINVSLGLIGSLFIAFVGSHILLSVHALSAETSVELQNSTLSIALILPLTLASGISVGALDAQERFIEGNILQVVSYALVLVVPLVAAAIIGPQLPVVMLSLLITRFITTIAMLAFNVAEFGTLRVLKFDRASAKKLTHFGGWISVTNLLSELMTSLDQFLIGSILGAKFVAFYSVPMNASLRMQVFSSTVARTLFPRFSRVEEREAMDVAQGALFTLSFLSVLVYAPVLSTLAPLLTIWLGGNFAASAMEVAPILVVGAWINGLTIVSYSLIQGQGRPDLVAKAHICEILPYFAALWFLIHRFGIVGAAFAWSLRGTTDFLILWAISKIPFSTAIRLLPSFALMAAALAVVLCAAHLSWVEQFVFGIAIFLAGSFAWVSLDVRARDVLLSLGDALNSKKRKES